jgi:hypothetical protein
MGGTASIEPSGTRKRVTDVIVIVDVIAIVLDGAAGDDQDHDHQE